MTVKNNLLKNSLFVLACSLGLQGAVAQTTLASWTFEGGYASTTEDDGKITVLTPDGSDYADVPTVWFSSSAPLIYPDECVGAKTEYSLTALSTGRFWTVCTGYNNHVLRIENTEANEISDFTDASQHNVYYELKFPTIGYKNISVEYAIAAGNNTASPVEAVVSTDGGKTWFDAGNNLTAATWWTYDKKTVSISANNKPEVLVRLICSTGPTNWNLDYVTVTGEEAGDEPIEMYNFSVTYDHECGSVTCDPAGVEFEKGTSISVTATENFGYHFKGWVDENDKTVSTDNPYSFELSADTSLKAVYDKKTVYTLDLSVKGGAADYLVQFQPAGNIVDGVHQYEEGTEVKLTAVDNRIFTFSHWDDNSTSPERVVVMNADKDITANYTATGYIVGWDFYNDDPAKERPADFMAESDNEGLLSLRDADGNTTGWLSRGVKSGQQHGKYCTITWKPLANKYYYEISFSSRGYTNLKLSASVGDDYNTYSVIDAEYSTDGKTFTKFGTFNPPARGWDSKEFNVPAAADNQDKVWIRFMPDFTSDMVGVQSTQDGTSISDIYVLADKKGADIPTGIDLIETTDSEIVKTEYYTLDGIRVSEPSRGFYIVSVHYADGSVKNSKRIF